MQEDHVRSVAIAADRTRQQSPLDHTSAVHALGIIGERRDIFGHAGNGRRFASLAVAIPAELGDGTPERSRRFIFR